MNRNIEARFSQIPAVDLERSIFDLSHGHLTTFNVGQLIPLDVQPVIPGDTFKVTTSKVLRLQTMLTPTFSNLYADFFHFFVPYRLIWEHFEEFMGENKTGPWIQSVSRTIPAISAPSGGFATGTLADYMGLPVGVQWNATDSDAPSVLPFRAYAKIVNDWFVSEAVNYPLNIPVGDSNQTGTNGSSFINDVANGGVPYIAPKYFDLFSSSLPSPQKGPSVTFPLLSGTQAPVKTAATDTISGTNLNPLTFVRAAPGTPYTSPVQPVINSSSQLAGNAFTGSVGSSDPVPSNLYADLASSVGAVTVNELRLAFQLQKFYERCARGGTRYIEMIKSHFGVTSPDARLQRSEYLGGSRVPLNVHEITNSAQTSTDFLGDVGAKSATSDVHEDFEKSFVEHGLIMTLCCVRYDHTYSQGIEKFWTCKDLMSQYFPVFANVGEMPVNQSEIFATSTNIATPVTWGYNEAYYWLRYRPDRISGEMRPGISNTLASWHTGDYYTSAPTLSASWLQEDKSNVDRVLAVQSSTSNQIFCDIWFDVTATRCLPMYSIPGLIDHH